MATTEQSIAQLSKLEEALESYRNKETMEILLTPTAAQRILYESLLGYYKASVPETDPKVEVLARIAGFAGKERVNYTTAFNMYEKGRRDEAERRQRLEETVNVVGPRQSKPQI